MGALVVGLEALRARPGDERLAHGVAALARQQAHLDRHDLLPAAGAVEAERGALRRGRPGVLELVAVGVLAHGGHDRLERRIGQAGDALERVEHLLLLVLELALVAQVLPAAAAAGAEVRARRLDAIGAARQPLVGDRLAVAALDALDARHDAIARERAIDEDDDAVMARDATPTRCERVDGELELLSDPKRRSHAGSIGGSSGSPGQLEPAAAPRTRARLDCQAGSGREHAASREHAEADATAEPEAAVARGVGQRAQRDGGERAAAEERRGHERDGLAGARRARELAGDQVEHAVEAERAEAEQRRARRCARPCPRATRPR